MKKFFIFACVIGLVVSTASPLFAGGADNKTNWSAEYIRSLNRNAATDSADIVMYNPAGVMKMEDGLYGNVSFHHILKDYNNEINGVDYDQDKDSTVPGLFAVYKRDRWSGFFGLSNVVGGGKVEFDNGLATTYVIGAGYLAGYNSALAGGGVPAAFHYTGFTHNLEGEHIGLGYTLGGAYKINDMFSVSLAARFVDTERDFKGGATLTATNPLPGVNDPVNIRAEFDEEADGWGGVIGLNVSPNDQWNIGIRYETKVDLDYETEVKEDTHGILSAFDVVNGGERTRNLPAIFGLGASYQMTPKVRFETNLTYYFNEDADFVDLSGTSQNESAVDNGFDWGIAVEYAISNTVKGSFGYLYTETGVDVENMTPWLPELDAHTLGTGVAWAVTPNFDVNVGMGRVFYQSESYVHPTPGIGTIKYEKDITFLAFGLQYKFM